MLKKAIGRILPYPAIEAGRRVLHLGSRRCELCGAGVRAFGPSGYGLPVLEELQVVGGMRRHDDRCPVCHATARERLVWFWISGAGASAEKPLGVISQIAHFAPEKGLTKRLRKLCPAGYRAYDIDPARYRHLADVEFADLAQLPVESDSCELVVCNHVLEHVPDMPLALAELYRITAPDGVAILQVPIAHRLAATIEMPPESSPQEREVATGQHDHLRLLTEPDYLAHLRRAGFAVERFDAFAAAPDLAESWRLDPEERLYLCRKLSNDIGELDR